ncbi:mechanosensitive ion channel [Candidatus Thorarchaeota archaeon]|nr:MAG: mechanosensitive ion channel [Candidatus Thorarchaeota archaeon]
MQQGPWESFVGIIRSLLTPIGLGGSAEFIAILPFLILIYIIYLATVRATKISFRKVGMPREAGAGLIFLIRLIFFGIAFVAVLAVTNLAFGQELIALSALIGTAVGLAFSKSLSNLVSGIYVLAARPFRVGDYVRIGTLEGIVLEVTLNYTRLLLPDYNRQYVPNTKVLESEVTNFRIRIDDYMANRGREWIEEQDYESRVSMAVEKLRYLTKGDEIFRYTFDIHVHRDHSIQEIREIFDSLCKEWRFKFVQLPEYFYWSNTHLGLIFRFEIIVKEAKQLLTVGADFQEVLAQSVTRR